MPPSIASAVAGAACWSVAWIALYSTADSALSSIGCPPLAAAVGAAGLAGGGLGGIAAARDQHRRLEGAHPKQGSGGSAC